MAQTITLNFKIIGQSLERLDDNRIVEKAKNYVNAHFEFNELWDDTTKAILIEGSGLRYKVYLNENNECSIPNRVVRHDGFTLTVVGEDADKNITITTNDLFISILSNNATDDTPSYVEVIESNTLDVTREGEKYNLEIPNTYVDETKLNDAIKLYRHTTTLECSGHFDGTIWVDIVINKKEAFTDYRDLLQYFNKYKLSTGIVIYNDSTGETFNLFAEFLYDKNDESQEIDFTGYGVDEDNLVVVARDNIIQLDRVSMMAYTPEEL